MVLVGLPSNNASIVTKESIALVTSKLKCEFMTLTSITQVTVDTVLLRSLPSLLSRSLLALLSLSSLPLTLLAPSHSLSSLSTLLPLSSLLPSPPSLSLLSLIVSLCLPSLSLFPQCGASDKKETVIYIGAVIPRRYNIHPPHFFFKN
jgi:hypothetical protein